MAKSLRSKWKRKCRAVKRVRYGKKELDQLRKTVLNDPAYKEPNDVEIQEPSSNTTLSDIVTIVDKKSMKLSRTDNQEAEEPMETNEKKRRYNPRTMRDENGTYPVWMNQRRIHEKKNLTRAAEKKKKKLRKKGRR